MKNTGSIIVSAFVASALFCSSAARAKDWFPLKVDVWDPPFNTEGKKKQVDYTPLAKAKDKYHICAVFPHLKDAYWVGVNFGVVEEAKREQVNLQLMEAGGYTNLNKEISQIEDCVAGGAKAVIVGAISSEGLNNLFATLHTKNIPVVELVTGTTSPYTGAKSMVSFAEMGAKTGEFLAKLHPAGSPPVNVAWLPGPAGAEWVETGNKGFVEAVKGSAIKIVDTKYGDTGKEIQAKLVEDVLQAHPDLNYIVGTAVSAEAAIPILRSRNLQDKVKLVAYYYGPGIDQAIRTGSVLAAPTDSPVIQGRVSLDQAVRLIEGSIGQYRQVGPIIRVVTKSNIGEFNMLETLAPNGFRPVFEVK
ncbi:TMAO reductase system periplasmic protein TorT [Paraburkholderia sediminicola]|uniref:TMAO reductase system periplasmic protein TorT n=1 Tax=Paraburkholderia sediminicola TaxID=458836 RepID=UPI0038B6C046